MDHDTCRCGHTGSDDTHPCHSKAYTCGKPAKRRFYDVRRVGLAGVQWKFQAQDTWACDDCWAAAAPTK